MAYEHMLCEDTDSTGTFEERRKRATAEAKSICDIEKPDNGADVIVTIKVSGNALVSVLNALEARIVVAARADAKEGVKPYPADSLRLYAIVEQLRDQLTEERQRLRDGPKQEAARFKCTDERGNVAYIHKSQHGWGCTLANGTSAAFFYAVGYCPDEMALRFELEDAQTNEQRLTLLRKTAPLHKIEMI